MWLLICYVSIVAALNIKNYYRTRGLNVITLDLDGYDEVNEGQTTLNIIIDNNSQSSYPYLSYCYIDNQQTIKSILSSVSAIESHIESNKKYCIFDNNALLLRAEIQQIVLCDYLDEVDEWIYNQFSVYTIKQRLLQIYIYSDDDCSYTVTIKGSAKGECFNSCNNNGSCNNDGPSYCICNISLLDSTCQTGSTLVQSQSVVKFELPASDQHMFTIPVNKVTGDLSIDLMANYSLFAYLVCQVDKEYLPFYLSNGFNERQLQTGTLTLSQSEISDCSHQIQQINFVIGQNITINAILLLVNNEQTPNDVQLKIYNSSNDSDSNGLQIYYILAGALGALMVALLIIICLIYCQRRGRRNGNQIAVLSQNTLKSPKQKLNLKDDFIPVELYEQILQEYPGLREINDCQICLIEFEKQDLVKLTYCLHLFHAICLDQWRKRNQTCPFCREELTKQKYVQHKQEEQIYKLGIVQGDLVQIDEQKAEEIQRRENRLKQLTSSPATINQLTFKENSPCSGNPFLNRLGKDQQ